MAELDRLANLDGLAEHDRLANLYEFFTVSFTAFFTNMLYNQGIRVKKVKEVK